MNRKVLSLIALLAVGGSLAAWGYAQDAGREQAPTPARLPSHTAPAGGEAYPEPGRFQPPPVEAGSLTNALHSAGQAVAAEHGAETAGDQPSGETLSGDAVQQTGGIEWLLGPRAKRKQAEAAKVEPTEAAPAATPAPSATQSRRGPAPVTVDFHAAKNYREASTPASTANATPTPKFKPAASRLLPPEGPADKAAEPRVASRPLGGAPGAAGAPPQVAPISSKPLGSAANQTPSGGRPPAIGIESSSLSDRGFAAAATQANEVLLSAVAPQLEATVVGPQAMVVGRAARYVVRMANGSNAAARNIQVKIKAPAWVSVEGANTANGVARAAESMPGEVVWTLSELAGGATAELTLQLAATEPRSVTLDVSYSLAPSTATASIAVQQPKLEVAISGPSEIQFGETQRYTLSISNPGSGPADDVVLQLKPLSRNLEAGVTQELGSLAAGERKSLDIELVAEEAGQMAVQAAVTAAGGLSAETRLDVHVRRAALEIAVVGPPQKFAGTEAAYQLKVSNRGDAAAHNVVLAALLPDGAQVLDSTEGASAEPGNLGWNIGSLAAGDARVFNVVCSLTKAGENRLEGRVRSGDGLTASQTVRTTVEAIADLKMFVNDPTGPVAVGKEAQYEIRILNRGSKAAENVVVKGYFSEGIEPESLEGALGKVDVGQALFDPIGRIEAGEELVIRIKARASAGGNHIFRAVVECGNPDTRLVSEETTRYFETVAAGAANGQMR